MLDIDRSEEGLTLIELLIAMMVMGIALTVLLGGMVTTVTASGLHKQQAIAEVELRKYAELVKAARYEPDGRYDNVGYSAPEHYVASKRVDCVASPCTPLQKIRLTISTDDDRVTEWVEVVKRP